VNADSEPITELPDTAEAFDLELVYRAQYSRIARVIARVVRDPARAEELCSGSILEVIANSECARCAQFRLALSHYDPNGAG